VIKEQLAKVLEQNNLGEHTAIFNNLIDNEKYSLENLKELSTDEMYDLGITKITHRKTIARLISNLSSFSIQTNPQELFDTEQIAKLELNPLLMAPIREYVFSEPSMPKGKLLDMCHAVENIYKLIALFGVSLLVKDRKLDNKLKKFLATSMKVPSLRSWKEITEFIFTHYLTGRPYKNLANFILQDARAFITPDDAKDKSLPKNSFISLRNSIAHSVLTNNNALSFLEIWHPKFVNLICNNQVLGKLKLVSITRKESVTITSKNLSKILEKSNSLKIKPSLEMSFGTIKARLDPFILLDHFKDEDNDVEDIKIYNRTFNRSVGFSASLSSLFKTDSSKKTLSKLLELFDYEKPSESIFEYPDQAEKIIDKSREIWGRESEVSAILEGVESTKNEVSLVTGVAGSGKSAVFLRVCEQLLHKSSHEPALMVIPYQLTSVDVNKSTHQDFFKYCNERIKHYFNINDNAIKSVLEDYFKDERASPRFIFLALSKFLEINEIGRILIVMDGLDEAMKASPSFTKDTILSRYLSGTKIHTLNWLIFSRNHPAAFKDLSLLKPTKIFPSLPPMSEEDMRLFILNEINIPPIQKKLLAEDKDCKDGKSSKNKFIQAVMDRAKGYPLYVKYLIHDLRTNKFPQLDISILPPSLDAYHQKIVEELALGDLAIRQTPIIVILALALEPLTLDEIYEIFIKVFPRHDNKPIFKDSLESLSHLLTKDLDPEGEEGYKLHHESFREFVCASSSMRDTISIHNHALCELSTNPESLFNARNYFYRCGYRHLIENNEIADLQNLFLDFTYVSEMSHTFDRYNLQEMDNPRSDVINLDNGLESYGTVLGKSFYQYNQWYNEEINLLIIKIWQKHISKKQISIANLYKKHLLPSWLKLEHNTPLVYEYLVDFLRREYPNPEIDELLNADIFLFIAEKINASKDDFVTLLLLQADYRYSKGQYKAFLELIGKIEKIRSVDISKSPTTDFIVEFLIPHLNREIAPLSKADIKAGKKPMAILELRGEHFRSEFKFEDKRFYRHFSEALILERVSSALRYLNRDKETIKYLSRIIKVQTEFLLQVDVKKLGIPESSWMGEFFLLPIISAAEWLPAGHLKSNKLILQSLQTIEPYILKFNKNFAKYEYRYSMPDFWNSFHTLTLLTLFDKFVRFDFTEGAHYLFKLLQKTRSFEDGMFDPLYGYEFGVNLRKYRYFELRYFARYDYPRYLTRVNQHTFWKDISLDNYIPLNYKEAHFDSEVAKQDAISRLDQTRKLDNPGKHNVEYAFRLSHILECSLYSYSDLNKEFKKTFQESYSLLLDICIFLLEQDKTPASERKYTFTGNFDGKLIMGCRSLFNHAKRLDSHQLKMKSAKLFKRAISLRFSKVESHPAYWTEILDYINIKS